VQTIHKKLYIEDLVQWYI